MGSKILPIPQKLRELLRYDPDTGKLFWLPRPREMFTRDRLFVTWNKRFSGKEAFTATSRQGYKVGAVFDVVVAAHKVIWAMEKGYWPSQQIDHVSGQRSDNRIRNLREATSSQNSMNTKIRSDNTSGYRGVSFHKLTGKWVARIVANKSRFYLGMHPTAERASEAYEAASKKYHGEFSRVT